MSNPNMNLKIAIPFWNKFVDQNQSEQVKSFINAFMRNAEFKFIQYDGKTLCSLKSKTELEVVRMCNCDNECECDTNETIKHAINLVYTVENEKYPIIYPRYTYGGAISEIPNFEAKLLRSDSAVFKFCTYYTKTFISDYDEQYNFDQSSYDLSVSESNDLLSLSRIDAINLPFPPLTDQQSNYSVQIKPILLNSGIENSDSSLLLSTLPLSCKILTPHNGSTSSSCVTDNFKIVKYNSTGEIASTEAYYTVTSYQLTYNSNWIKLKRTSAVYEEEEESIVYEYEEPSLEQVTGQISCMRGLFIGRMQSDDSGRIVFGIACAYDDNIYFIKHLYKVANDDEYIPKEIIVPAETSDSEIESFECLQLHLIQEMDLSLNDDEYFRIYNDNNVEMLIDDMSNVGNLLKITTA